MEINVATNTQHVTHQRLTTLLSQWKRPLGNNTRQHRVEGSVRNGRTNLRMDIFLCISGRITIHHYPLNLTVSGETYLGHLKHFYSTIKWCNIVSGKFLCQPFVSCPSCPETRSREREYNLHAKRTVRQGKGYRQLLSDQIGLDLLLLCVFVPCNMSPIIFWLNRFECKDSRGTFRRDGMKPRG